MKTISLDFGTHIQVWQFTATDAALIETRRK